MSIAIIALMTAQEAGQPKYPEIELRKPIRPFSQKEVEYFLVTPGTKLEKNYMLNGNPIRIAIAHHQVDPLSVADFAYAPFGNIHSTITIRESGIDVESDEGFCGTVLDINRKFGPHDCEVIISIEEERGIIGRRDREAVDKPFFIFGPLGNRRNGFLIPYGKDLSSLGYTFK